MCNYANRQNTGEAWKNYLINFPKGACAAIAESELQKRGISLPVKGNNNAKINSQDQKNCDFARSKDTLYAWKAYIKEYPKGVCHFEAKIRISELEEDDARRKRAAKQKPKIEPEPVVKLQWSDKSENKMKWDEAIYYCSNLNENGFSDWAMPIISELRNLVRNCSPTQIGGSCPFSDNYVEYRGYRNRSCASTPICYCSSSNMGIYSVFGDKETLWSSITAVDKYFDNYCNIESVDNYREAFGINFSDASILPVYKTDRNYVRCVRKSR